MVTTVTWQPSCVVLGTCCLSSLSGDRLVSSSPLISENAPGGDKPGRPGQQGTCRDPPGSSRIRSGAISHKALVVFKTGNNCIDLWNNKNNIVKKTRTLTLKKSIRRKVRFTIISFWCSLPGSPPCLLQEGRGGHGFNKRPRTAQLTPHAHSAPLGCLGRHDSHSGPSPVTELPRAEPLCLSGVHRLWAGRPVISTPQPRREEGSALRPHPCLSRVPFLFSSHFTSIS